MQFHIMAFVKHVSRSSVQFIIFTYVRSLTEQKTQVWLNFEIALLISDQIIKIRQTLTTKCDYPTVKNHFCLRPDSEAVAKGIGRHI
jgi:hypothetical protein